MYKLPQTKPQIIPYKKFNIQSLIDKAKKRVKLPKEDSFYQNFMQLSRVTLKVENPAALHHIKDDNQALKKFDLIAVETKNEKVFTTLCMEPAVKIFSGPNTT
jgi:RNase P/RNase MRP subunit p30